MLSFDFIDDLFGAQGESCFCGFVARFSMFPSGSHASFLRIPASLNLHRSCALEANTVRLLHLAVTICIVALKVLSGHIMKGRIHWTNIASILVCPLIFESPNYINLEQLKVFKALKVSILKQFGADQSLFIFLKIFGQGSFSSSFALAFWRSKIIFTNV